MGNDGMQAVRWSCDTDSAMQSHSSSVAEDGNGKMNNWSRGTVVIEPGATDVEISFARRTGYPVYAVDHSKEGKPWVKAKGKKVLETFHCRTGDTFEERLRSSGDDVTAHFWLEGSLCRCVDRFVGTY